MQKNAGPARCGIAVFVCCFLTPFAFTQIGANAQPTSDTRYKLSGTVSNAISGEPVRRALVEIYANGQHRQLTDSSGNFEFDNLPPGQAVVNVTRPGFFPQNQDDIRARVQIGPDLQPLLLKLIPEAVIYGQVQSSDGQPIENLQVRVFSSRVEQGNRQWQQVQATNTDDEGDFRIANLTPGTYYLEAGPSWPRPDLLPNKNADAYSVTFYPGGSDLSSAAPLEVGPGQQANAVLVMKPSPLFKISGTISGIVSGHGLDLQFMDNLGGSYPSGKEVDPATGSFHALVPAGSYTLQATSLSRNGPDAQAELPLQITSDMAGIRLVLNSLLLIPVGVRNESTRPVAVSQRLASGTASAQLIQRGNVIGGRDYIANSEQTPQGPSLAFRDVRPGKYSLEINANSPWYVESAQCGSVDLLRDDLVITTGQTSPIEIRLRDNGASLTARIEGGEGHGNSTVILVPERSPSHILSASVTNGANVNWQSLAPGAYKVFAFDRVDGLEYANPDVLEKYSSKAAEIILQPNQQAEVSLDLINVTD